jgi:hypothetical protein
MPATAVLTTAVLTTAVLTTAVLTTAVRPGAGPELPAMDERHVDHIEKTLQG